MRHIDKLVNFHRKESSSKPISGKELLEDFLKYHATPEEKIARLVLVLGALLDSGPDYAKNVICTKLNSESDGSVAYVEREE